MFKWLDRWFKDKISEVIAESKQDKSEDDDFDLWFEEKSLKKDKPFNNENGMTFTIYPARGGFVVEYRQYNDKTQEMDHGLHIITSDQELGDALGKIITIQQLIK